MAVPTFSEYTYKISYKATSSSAEVILSEELRIIGAKTNIIDDSGASVEAPNPNYDYFMTALVCKVTPQKKVDNDYKERYNKILEKYNPNDVVPSAFKFNPWQE